MPFLDHWRSQLPACMAHLVTHLTPDTALSCSLVATAVLWPIRSTLRAQTPEAMSALMALVGEQQASLSELVSLWPEDLLAAANHTSEAARSFPLAHALLQLTSFFQADTLFLHHLQNQFPIHSSHTDVPDWLRLALIHTAFPHPTLRHLSIGLTSHEEVTNTLLEASYDLLAQLPLDEIPERPIDRSLSSYSLPLPAKHFVGRKEAFAMLASHLKRGETALLVTGIPGVGKRALVREFAYRYGRYFAGGVCWLAITNRTDLTRAVAACGAADALALFAETENLSLQDQCACVRAAWTEPTPRLLILEFGENLSYQRARQIVEDYLPHRGGCRVLITSTATDWSSGYSLRTIVLEPFNREESVSLVRAYRPDFDDSHAAALADYLTDLPLAITLAGSFLAYYRHTALGDGQRYLDRLGQHRVAHRWLPPHEQALLATSTRSFQALHEGDATDRMALTLLTHAASCAPDEAIPRFLLERVLYAIHPELNQQPSIYSQAMEHLVQLGLLEAHGDDVLSLAHPIAHALHTQAGNPETPLPFELILLTSLLTALESDHPSYILPLLPHVRHQYQIRSEHEDLLCSVLAISLANAERKLMNYPAAQHLYEHALRMVEQMVGSSPIAQITCLTNLATLYQLQGKYEEAKPLFERAVLLKTRAVGSSDPTLASNLTNLALLYKEMGRYEEAEQLLHQVLDLYKQTLEPVHFPMLSTINNLASLSYLQGNYAEAEARFHQALTLLERSEPEHPTLPTIRANLSACQEVLSLLAHAEMAVTHALADPASDRQALRYRLELQAQKAASGERLGSPHLHVAAHLRELAAKLQVPLSDT